MLIKKFEELEAEVDAIGGGNFSINTFPKRTLGDFPVQDFQQYGITVNNNTIFISTIIFNNGNLFTSPIISIKNSQNVDITLDVFEIPDEDREEFEDEDFECTKDRLIKALNWLKNN